MLLLGVVNTELAVDSQARELHGTRAGTGPHRPLQVYSALTALHVVSIVK